MPPSFPTSILRIASISLRRRVDLQVPLGQQEKKTSAIRVPKSQMMFRFFRNVATLDSFVNQLRQIRKQKNLSLMYMDLPIWGAEARISCLFPHSKRSQWKFFTVLFFFYDLTRVGRIVLTWLISGRSLWTKAVGSMQLRNTFGCEHSPLFQTRWPVTPKCIFLRNQWPLVSGVHSWRAANMSGSRPKILEAIFRYTYIVYLEIQMMIIQQKRILYCITTVYW